MELNDDVKFWLYLIGWTGGTIVLCYYMYKWFAVMVGKEVARALIGAGVVAVL